MLRAAWRKVKLAGGAFAVQNPRDGRGSDEPSRNSVYNVRRYDQTGLRFRASRRTSRCHASCHGVLATPRCSARRPQLSAAPQVEPGAALLPVEARHRAADRRWESGRPRRRCPPSGGCASSSTSAASPCARRSRISSAKDAWCAATAAAPTSPELAIKKPVFPLVSFTHDVREHGLEPGARVLRFEVAPPAPDVAAALELKPGEQMLLLKRLRLANQQAAGRRDRPPRRRPLPGPARRGPDRPLALRNPRSTSYGIVADRAQQQWQAVPCPINEAHCLEVDPGSPVLRIEQTTFDAEGRPFEHLESYFRGDKFILVAELRNDRQHASNGDAIRPSPRRTTIRRT